MLRAIARWVISLSCLLVIVIGFKQAGIDTPFFGLGMGAIFGWYHEDWWRWLSKD